MYRLHFPGSAFLLHYHINYSQLSEDHWFPRNSSDYQLTIANPRDIAHPLAIDGFLGLVLNPSSNSVTQPCPDTQLSASLDLPSLFLCLGWHSAWQTQHYKEAMTQGWQRSYLSISIKMKDTSWTILFISKITSLCNVQSIVGYLLLPWPLLCAFKLLYLHTDNACKSQSLSALGVQVLL